MKKEHKEEMMTMIVQAGLGSIAQRLGTGAIDFETAYKEALSLIATIEADEWTRPV